jgi:hypothetical protein
VVVGLVVVVGDLRQRRNEAVVVAAVLACAS